MGGEEQPSELDDDDEAPVAEPIVPPTPVKKKPDWGSLLQEEDSREQDELKDEYNQMLNTDDPDQVDKAMKAAWHKMQQEDRHFTMAMQHTVKRKPKTTVAPPLSERAQHSDQMFAAFGSERIAAEESVQTLHPRPKRHRLMLNQRQVSVRREAASASAHPVMASPPPREQRMNTAAAPLPSAAALDAEAAVAEDADF
jgi:hypothetical protein